MRCSPVGRQAVENSQGFIVVVTMKKKRCVCQGHYSDNWQNWRVIERVAKPGASMLYCLECRQEWRSLAKYVVLIPCHEKDDRSGLTDGDVLIRIQEGSLLVNVETCEVRSVTRRGGEKVLRVVTRRSNGSEYRFVEVSRGGRKKKVALHRLVWMAANRRTVPSGHDVDHRKDQSDDSIGNLRLMDSSSNRSRKYNDF